MFPYVLWVCMFVAVSAVHSMESSELFFELVDTVGGEL